MNEESFLSSEVRRGGIFKLIEQAVGWNIFAAGFCLFGLWIAVYAVVSIWKAYDPTPDVAATEAGLKFHPAVRRSPARYEEISNWSLEIVSGHPVLWIRFYKPYWSLQGLFRRTAVKLEGGREQLKPLVDFFAHHSLMRTKFTDR
jgi:hypothetical protein